MNRTWRTSLAALVAAAACSEAVVAYACSYLPVSLRAASELVPVSGPIVIEIVCQETDFCETESIDDVTVTGPSGAVPGTFETVRGGAPAAFVVWRPSAPLEAGESYAVRISEPTVLELYGEAQPLDVRADEAFHWDASGEPTWKSERVSEDVGERFCCFAAQACFDHCFTEARAVKVTLAPAAVVARENPRSPRL